MPLHLDYRPNTLEELLGNDHIKESLKAVLESPDRPRTFLIHGPTGTGKTTIGRIITKMIGCADEDIKELNVSDTRGIESAREMIRELKYYPLLGDVKAYILDEVQSATSQFMESMLKPLEDTPEHVVFILCTTDPQKLKPTIRNRCTAYETVPLPGILIKKLLKNVLKKEKVDDFPTEALDYIVQYSKGVPREALVLLNQVIDIPTDEGIITTLKSYKASEEQVESLVKLMLNNAPWTELAKALKEMKDQDVEKVRRGVLGYCNVILLNSGKKRAAMLMDLFKEPMYDMGTPGISLACFQSTL